MISRCMPKIEISEEVLDYIQKHKNEDESESEFLMRLFKSAENDISRKILFIGPPEAGKSSIRLVFFDDKKPKSLLDDPIEPTRGIENYMYNWLDVKTGIADSSGQEINRWLNQDREMAFNETDSIIFVFDVSQFAESYQEICEKIAKALQRKTKLAPRASFSIFLHKIDLLPEEKSENMLKTIKQKINAYLTSQNLKREMLLITYYATSIKGELILNLYKSMRSILYPYSNVIKNAILPSIEE